MIVKPERLTSLGVISQQVFEALEKNNSNASGNSSSTNRSNTSCAGSGW